MDLRHARHADLGSSAPRGALAAGAWRGGTGLSLFRASIQALL
jgi:hypothetical protein